MSNVKRLIEVDLPIRRISDAARAGRSRRSGNLSALHYWWARRPTAACRSLALATMLPDPLALAEEEHERALEPRDGQGFLQRAAGVLEGFLPRWVGLSSGDSSLFLDDLDRNGFKLSEPLILRRALLEFIADFAIEENAANEEFIAVARSLTRVAHAVLNPVTERPLIIDPFAGGGAIPVECVRVGADVVASDLNPVSVLLNKVLLEGGARGVAFAERVERWGDELLRRARAYLGNFYPKDEDGATPIAYLWARTLRCTGPGCGKTIPLIGNLQVTKRRSPPIIARVTHENGGTQVTLQERPPRTKSQEKGTVRGGVVHCPFCGFSTEKGEYRQRAANGELGEQMFGVVLQYPDGRPRKYRTPTERDIAAFNEGAQSAAALVPPWSPTLSPFPDEPLSPDEPRRLNVRGYGYTDWGSMFNSRQSLALATFGATLDELRPLIRDEDSSMAELVVEALALSISNITHYNSRMSTYLSDGLISAFIQSSAIGMKADYAEANPLMVDLVGGYEYQIEKTVDVLQTFGFDRPGTATVLSSPAQELPLPDASADALITDPPYYYSIPYADLSDLFYGWLRRFLFREELSFMSGIDTPKQKEASQSLPHSKSPSSKDSAHYENALTESFGRARRIVAPHGVGVIVFAHTETSAWESLLSGILQSGWVVTGSWPIDTENRSRMLANRQRSLSSSVHLVVRPREFSDGSLDESSVGDWRDVLGELPVRIRAWLPRLAAEGVVGADAIFACLGPALEIYSKYARVEKASGEVVTLREYLEQVWAAVSREALSMVFENADATGFEEDARLTAMFLWTLAAGVNSDGNGEAAKAARSGFSLEYDAARKIAQGLGAHLEQMSGVVEVKGETARLLPVTERVRFLFGKDAEVSSGGGSRGSQGSLFEELAEIEGGSGLSGRVSVPSPGETTLDQVHQAMILFGTNQTEALRQFLVDDWVGKYGRFWSLAQALAALYPQGSDERRWVEGVLARKTPLGL